MAFTRDPGTGEDKLYGEFLLNAQGEDVVAGIRTPHDIDELKRLMPSIYEELQEVRTRLEEHYGDMQDLEFTVEEGTLYILQTRDGKRTGPAALKIAVDMVDDGLVAKDHTVKNLVEPGHLEQLPHPQFAPDADYEREVMGEGLPASPGAAVGRAVFTAEDAEEWNEEGEDVILVRVETSPEDVGGMDAAEGILTSRGGMTSHAAVVARGWGKPCVAGCDDIVVNYDRKSFTNGQVTVEEGDWISINGSTGEVVVGKQPLVDPELSGEFERFRTCLARRLRPATSWISRNEPSAYHLVAHQRHDLAGLGPRYKVHLSGSLRRRPLCLGFPIRSQNRFSFPNLPSSAFQRSHLQCSTRSPPLPHTNPLAGLERFRQVVERPDLPHRHIILAGNLPERVASANRVVSSLCRVARLGEGPALNRHLVCDVRHALDARHHAFGRAVLLARLHVAAQRETSPDHG